MEVNMDTLEDILKKYKFLPKNKNAFLQRIKIVDGIPEYCTFYCAFAYRKLISLLYDIGELVNFYFNDIVDIFVYIFAYENYKGRHTINL